MVCLFICVVLLYYLDCYSSSSCQHAISCLKLELEKIVVVVVVVVDPVVEQRTRRISAVAPRSCFKSLRQSPAVTCLSRAQGVWE